MFRKRRGNDSNAGVHWLDASENPWPVPVLDVRPITLGMVSTTTSAEAAANAISFRGDDGRSFADMRTPTTRSVSLDLRYRIDRVLADGVLFIPTEMEHKWAVFHHREQLLFVRSWMRQTMVAAATQVDGGDLRVVQAEGAFTDHDEPPELTAAILDFIIRTHALGIAHPAPLQHDPGKDLRLAGLWCFSMFGNRASFATHHPYHAPPPDAVLRSHSLFHIAVARADFTAVEAQLDAGVPIDSLAADGLSAMHWALAAPNDDVLSWLIARGLAVDIRSAEGATALMNAIQDGDDGRVVWLLDHGSDPNAADDHGFTGLHRAAERGQTQTVRMLLERGATPTCEAQGHTPLSLAQARGHAEIVAVLGGTT